MKIGIRKRLAEISIDGHLPTFDDNDCRVEAPYSAMVEVEELLHVDQHRQMVCAAIVKLPESYRIVLNLRDIEGV